MSAKEKKIKETIGIIGLGYVGLPLNEKRITDAL